MSEMILEPYAAIVRWSLPAPPKSWSALLAGFLQELAQRCESSGDASGPCVIGHIKALALFPGGGFLRLSATASHLPVTFEGAVPPDCIVLDLTLNVIVYGLERSRLERLTREIAVEVARRQKGQVEFLPISFKVVHYHDEQHDKENGTG